MRYVYSALLVLIFVTFFAAFAQGQVNLEIVYPKNNSSISAKSTFFIGNTDPNAKLTINGKSVRVYPNGSFVHIIKLKNGSNKIKLKSKIDEKEKEVLYMLNVPEKTSAVNEAANCGNAIVPVDNLPAEVTKNNAVVRVTPEGSRLTPLQKGIRLVITGKIGNKYRFRMGSEMEGYISESDVRMLLAETSMPESFVANLNIVSSETSDLIKIALDQKLPITINELPGPHIVVTIYGGKAHIDQFPYNPEDKFIKEIKWIQSSKDTFQLIITPNSSQLWGYSYYYEDNTLVISLVKPPKIDLQTPLKDKIIAIDPGHGGSEPGSVGPTGIPEKIVNLAISTYLKQELEAAGAKVVMTRTSNDENPGLYERSEIANKNNALLLISIHNNALPDGGNPYEEHGTGVYYYNSEALPLAKSLQNTLVRDLGFRDNGIVWDSLALTRPTQPVSVLVEVGFMINPDEYALLITPEFQQKAAKALKNGIEDFFRQNAL